MYQAANIEIIKYFHFFVKNYYIYLTKILYMIDYIYIPLYDLLGE